MKKLLFSALIAVSLIASAFAHPVKNVSINIATAFESSFPDATNVKWEVTKNYAKASFTSDNIHKEAFYSLNGDFVGTSQAINIEDLPIWAKRNFAKKYGNYTVKEAIQFDAVEETAYFISAENDKQSVIVKAVSGTIEVYKSSIKN